VTTEEESETTEEVDREDWKTDSHQDKTQDDWAAWADDVFANDSQTSNQV